MECACEIDMDVESGDGWDFVSQKKVKSRKVWRCGECYRDIGIGETYENVRGMINGTIYQHRTCSDCLSLRETFFTSYYFETLWENFRDFVFDSCGGLSEECLAKLTPVARGKACEIVEEYWEWIGEDD